MLAAAETVGRRKVRRAAAEIFRVRVHLRNKRIHRLLRLHAVVSRKLFAAGRRKHIRGVVAAWEQHCLYKHIHAQLMPRQDICDGRVLFYEAHLLARLDYRFGVKDRKGAKRSQKFCGACGINYGACPAAHNECRGVKIVHEHVGGICIDAYRRAARRFLRCAAVVRALGSSGFKGMLRHFVFRSGNAAASRCQKHRECSGCRQNIQKRFFHV